MSSGLYPAEWLRGTLSLCVLGLLAEEASYGYAIAQRLEDAGLGYIKGGTLYPLLARLEAEALVAGTWSVGEGAPGRKYLQLTEAGHTELLRRRELWQQFSSTVDALAHSQRNQEHRNV